MPPNNPNGTTNMLVALQEERLQRLQDLSQELQGDLHAHTQTDDLRFQMLTKQVADLGDKVIEKIDAVAVDITVLRERSSLQGEKIAKLREKESARSKRNRFLLKAMWLLPAAILVESGHQIVLRFWGLK